jgi:hypothetical protein
VHLEALTWTELVARCGTPWRARRHVDGGVVRRVWPGVYVAADLPDTPRLRATALRRLLPDGVALSHRAAVWALGVDVAPADAAIDVTTCRGKHLEARGGLRPHSALLPDVELVDLPGGLLAVSAPRAFVDVARSEPLVEAVAFGDAVLRSGAATREQLSAALDRAGGLRGIVGARRVLPYLEPRSESQGESRLRMRLMLGGLPRPEAQVDYYDDDGHHVARADLVVDGAVLEYDGREQRMRKDVFVRDRRRQNALVDHGAELRRFTGSDVTSARTQWLCGQVRKAVARAASRPAPSLRRGPDTLRPPVLQPLPTRAELRDREDTEEAA